MTVLVLPRFQHVRLIVVLAATLAAIGPLHAQPTLRITSPATGTIFSPGQTITVSVSPSGSGFSFIGIVGQSPLGFTAPVYTPPYQFSILIPTTITPAPYTLTAMGVISQGQSVMSAPITVVVQRPDPPVSVRVQPSVLKLNIGKNAYLRVIGTYSDGSTADLTQAASTAFVSNSPAIATVTAQGAVTAVSSGSTTILVNGTVLVPVTVAPAAKIAPPQKALYAAQSQQFYPTLADASVPSVSWSLNPSLGSVSGTGLYTAPSSIASRQTVVLTATSTSNNTISAQSTITLLPQLAMSLSPSSTNLSPSQTVQFYASLSNTVNYGLNWSINPNVGQVGILGLYTAPASITSPQTVTVKATSTVDGTTAATAAINLQPTGPQVVSYSVQWGSESYNVIGTSRNRLPWQISGVQVVFSEPIASGNVNSLSGTGVTTTGFSGLGTNTLTWTISPLSLGNFPTTLAGTGGNALKDAGGSALAGGVGFTQNLKILWGDFNDDGIVNASDMTLVNNARSQMYNIFADMNGDGVVDTNDVSIVRAHNGTSLP